MVAAAPPVTAPADLLDASAFPDADWAGALVRNKPAEAVLLFVRGLRTGAARYSREDSIPAVFERWFGNRIGFSGGHHLDADMVVEQCYIGAYGVEHRFDGEIDWYFDPTRKEGGKQTKEWQAQINRHYQWTSLADAYERTGDAKYAHAWERELRSWVRQCPMPTEAGQRSEQTWRTIEAGIRSGWTWPYAFDVFRKSGHVTDEALWLCVAVLRDHARFLMHHGRNHNNWYIMETNGLAHVALMFPELKEAATFADAAMARAKAILDKQFYPDGVHTELAPSYAAGTGVAQLYSTLALARQKGNAQFEALLPRLNNTADALFRIADPTGLCPPLHDSPPVDVTGMFADFAKRIAPRRFGEPPWTTEQDTLVEWGGYAVFRSAGQFALLDAGPYGSSGHRHDDCLQFVLFADDRWFFIDSGKPRYDRSATTRHQRASASHNVVLMDSRDRVEAKAIAVVHKPMPLAFAARNNVAVAAATRMFVAKGHEKDATTRFSHERVVLTIEGMGWLVVDRLRPEDHAEHRWEWLWQTPVDRIAVDQATGTALATYDDGLGMHVIAAQTVPTEWKVNKGVVGRLVRGWRSEGPANEAVPSNVLRMVAEPTTGPVTGAALLIPAARNANAERIPSLSLANEETIVLLRVVCGADEWSVRVPTTEQIDRVDVSGPGSATTVLDIGPHS